MTIMTLSSSHLCAKHRSRVLGSLLALALITVGSSRAQEITESESEPITLATFHLWNGNTVEFHGSPADGGPTGGLGYSEKGTIGESMPIFFNNETLTILQRFLILAPEDTPLPRMLVESGGADYEERLLARLDSIDDLSKPGVPSLDQLVAQRGIVEELPELLEITLGMSELIEKFQAYAQGTPYLNAQSKGQGGGDWSCRNNDAGDFEDRFCDNWNGPEYCDKWEQRRHLYRSSKTYRRRTSYSVDVFCGGTGQGYWYVQPRHYWRDGSRWGYLYSGPRITGGEWGWSVWYGVNSHIRRVKHVKKPDRRWTGFFRAFTAFYD